MGSSSSFSVSTSAILKSSEEPANPTIALLSPSSSPSHRSPSAVLFSSLILTTFTAVAAALAFAFLFFSSHPTTTTAAAVSNPQHPSSPPLRSRPLTTLPHPAVILISSDGFRFGYQFKTPTPNIHRLIANGTEAAAGLIPVFPTLTFPNHYSIATGLYPAHHGIIDNQFLDPLTGDTFTMASLDPAWWLGEPLWETVASHGLTAATYFWPGSEVKKRSWQCPPAFCAHYNGSVPFEQRVDTVLSYFDLDTVPSFLTLYFEDPDHQGHQVGPDDPQITDAVARIDSLVGRLIAGLEKRGVFQDVTIILVGDHGMVSTCDKKLLFISDLAPWIEIPPNWIQSYTPVLAIRPPADSNFSPSQVVAKMNEALSSGKVENGNQLKMYVKEDLPERLHYSSSYRIPPIIGLLGEGFKVEQNRSRKNECGGAHGYDNDYFSMRTLFIGHGPRFERGRKVESFVNVEIYNVVTSILGIKGAPNNGTASFAESVLLPSSK